MSIKEDMHEFVNKYMNITAEERAAVVDYALSTWEPELPDNLKILHFVGGIGIGKTLALHAMLFMCNNVNNDIDRATDAALLHLLDMYTPSVLIVDDVDELLFEKDEDGDLRDSILSSILRVGTNKRTSLILRKTTDGFAKYNVFGHKIVAGMKVFDDPRLASRSLVIRLKEAKTFNLLRFEADGEILFEHLLEAKSAWEV